MQYKFLTLFILFTMWLSACDFLSTAAEEVLATATPQPATPVATPDAQSTPEQMDPETITSTLPTLIVWISPDLAVVTEQGVSAIEEQIQQYAAAHSGDVEIILEFKATSGQGGILNYIRTGRKVAPGILPHLIALPTHQLAGAAAEELIYPLDNWIDPSLIDDLYPVALSLAQSEERLLGYPFALTNLSHLAYDSSVVTDTIPADWNDFLDTGSAFLFPAAGRDGAILALQLYLAAGGVLTNEAGQLTLQVEPLTIALDLLSRGRANGVIMRQSTNIASFEESWPMLRAGSAAIVQTNANQYLRLRNPEQPFNATSIPGIDLPLSPLVSGWAWAITTTDDTQRALSLDLLQELVSPANLGEWSLQTYFLPAQEEAFASWPANDPYVAFLRRQLDRAQPMPLSPTSNLWSILEDAVYGVVSMSLTPQEAAEAAVAAVQS